MKNKKLSAHVALRYFSIRRKRYVALSLLVVVLSAVAIVGQYNVDSELTRSRPVQTAKVKPVSSQSKIKNSTDQVNKNQSEANPETPKHTSKVALAHDMSESKPKNTHASSLLKDKDYPQLRYEALATVSDPYFNGNYSGNWYHTKVQTSRAWDTSVGSADTVIAVIDSGFALNHEDLNDKWYINNGEQGMTQPGDTCHATNPGDKATNNCDDDQNGYVDDWRGWDFDSGDNNVQTGLTNATGNGVEHGTLVSSMIASTANNGIGNAGIDQRAKIMPIQALSDNGDGYTYDIVAAIQYAVNNGAHIINMSLGGNLYDQAMLDAVVYAKNQGVLVVVASGNCGNSSTGACDGLTAPGRVTYPAKYSQVLSVGSTSSNDVRSGFSSYGPELDIVAPGDNVGPLAGWNANNQTSDYYYVSGTSFSAPIVAGIAGLVRAQLASPTPDAITNILIDSVDKIPGLNGAKFTNEYGYGRVNAHKATLLATAIETPPVQIGLSAIQARQPARGGIIRSRTGNVANDEWNLVVCRVELSDVCSASITNGTTTVRFNPITTDKGASVYYLFLQGSSMQSGTSSVAVHNRHYATKIADLVK